MRKRLAAGRRHAPHLIDAEVGNVLRRHEREGRLSDEEAAHGLRAAAVLIDHRYPHIGPLGQLAWTLGTTSASTTRSMSPSPPRFNLPLVTADVRLSRAPRLPCTIELV